MAHRIAATLERQARQLAITVEDAELLAATLPPTPGITHQLARLREEAELLGIACAFFKEIAEHPETPVVFDRTVYGVPGVTKP